MKFIGIDPGKHGGVAILGDEGDIILADIMRETSWFSQLMQEHRGKERMVYLEKAQVMPKNGAVGMFNYGVHYGELQGVLIAQGQPYECVPPVTWSKVMQAGVAGDRPKERSKIAILRLFPHAILTNPDNPSSKKIHEGIMDAILIAEYGRRKWKGCAV